VNIALAPNAVRVLQHIGVLRELRDLGYNYEQLAVTNAHGQQLGLMYNGSAKEYNFKALRIHRAEVHKGELHRIINERFGSRWPEFIGQICREYNPKDLSQYPYVHSSFPSSPPH
jgi:2-polyprenyl-6-methoxyphenol hydroxylase-like FAD-dependent oxidoreductase